MRQITGLSEGTPMTWRWVDTLAIVGTCALVGCMPQSRTTGASAASSPSATLVVGRPRQMFPGETTFEDTLPLLREPENGNAAPGPHGMLAVMRADHQHHPRVYIVRQTMPDSLQLLIDRYATKPRWAPVGERLACTVWKSRRQPWALCIVSLGKPDTLYPLPGANAVRYR